MGGCRDRLMLVRSAAAALAAGATILVAAISLFKWGVTDSANIAIRYALPLVPIWLITALLFTVRDDGNARTEAETSGVLPCETQDRNQREIDLCNEQRAVEIVRHEKSRFLANISHEFRTPLNAIIGFADVLKQQYFGPLGDERYREYTGYICTSGEHLLALVNDLLDLSVIEAGQQALNCENMTAEDIVADSIRIFGVRADVEAVNLEVRIPEGLPPIHADRRLLKQVLLNLLSNAVKFTPKGGRVTVSADAQNGVTELRVADTGRGIPCEKLAEVTSPFQKGEGDPYLAEKGWGLGLAISKSIVELHNGALEIESQVGEGTTVSVKLPGEVS